MLAGRTSPRTLGVRHESGRHRAWGPTTSRRRGTVSFTIDVPAGAPTSLEFQADAELGKDRNAVVRVMISDRPEGIAARRRPARPPRRSAERRLRDVPRAASPSTSSLLPPNSHGEANPADKDPVPPPFDNTYNSPEHDAFVMKVKYQRNDRFFTDNMVDGADRARLNQAWNDLFGSWPYHDAYLGMLADHYELTLKSRRIAGHGRRRRSRRCRPRSRPHVTSLRAHYDEVMQAQALAQPGHVADALAFASRAWRRPLTAAEKASLRALLPAVAHGAAASITTRPSARCSRASWCRRRSSIAWRPVRAAAETAAQRLGDGQPHELLPVVVDSGRRAAPRRGRRRVERSGDAREAGAGA